MPPLQGFSVDGNPIPRAALPLALGFAYGAPSALKRKPKVAVIVFFQPS